MRDPRNAWRAHSSRSTYGPCAALESPEVQPQGESFMLRTALAIAILALPFAAQAQSYRCVGADGKKYYGSSVPPQCLGHPVEELNAQGMVSKRFDAAASAAEREKKEAEEAERKKREAIAKQRGRKDN